MYSNLKCLNLANFFRASLFKGSFIIFMFSFGIANAHSDYEEVLDETYFNTLEMEALATPCGNGLTTIECNIVQMVNNERRIRNLVPLQITSKCQSMARSHSVDMARNRFFSHTSPTQGSFSQRARRFNLTGTSGENIGMGSQGTTARAMMNLWMNSTGHRNNILKPSFRSIGVGAVSNGSFIYFTQCFNSVAN